MRPAAQRLGFTLDEIADLLATAGHRHGRPDAGLQERVKTKLVEVEAKIADLQVAVEGAGRGRPGYLLPVRSGESFAAVAVQHPKSAPPIGGVIHRLAECRFPPAAREIGRSAEQVFVAMLNGMSSVIEVENLHKSYGRTVAVDDVSFTVEHGEIFGILGRNGTGKTTTVECLVGLRTPDRGRIRVLGRDPRRDRAEVTLRVGVQLQDGQLPERLRVGEAMRLYASFYPDPADPAQLLGQLGLKGKENVPYAKLSGGQKQRLSIALALVGRPGSRYWTS